MWVSMVTWTASGAMSAWKAFAGVGSEAGVSRRSSARRMKRGVKIASVSVIGVICRLFVSVFAEERRSLAFAQAGAPLPVRAVGVVFCLWDTEAISGYREVSSL